MASYDIIEAALSGPIDWGVFEGLVAEVLFQDDMPRLRRAGGYKDSGVDAYETSLYSDESNADTVVQITSQRAQSLKVKATLERIHNAGLMPRSITFVFRHPVSSMARADIARQCAAANLRCDVRDQTYIMLQLGKNETGLFARYFESMKAQFAAFLNQPDPLSSVSDRTKHAVLLSVAAFMMHPRARLVRQALFQRTVAAALVAAGEATDSEIAASVATLMPEEEVPFERVASALADLERSGDCANRGGKWQPTDGCIARFSAVLGGVRTAYEHMLGTVLESCRTACRGDQASLGIAERNFRRALLRLLRMSGPLGPDDKEPPFVGVSSMPEVRACLSQDLKDNIARCLIVAFGGYVENPENLTSLALFGRSYSALALRNIDPVGRRWQQMALQRSVVALDTDAVLMLLIRELPEHASLLKAVEALRQEGTRIFVSPEVLAEATGHISRADRTFRKFASQMDNLSPAMADACIWHAVVRGYYYARNGGYTGTWKGYWAGYYDERNAEEFVRYQLSRLPDCTIKELDEIPQDWFADLEELTAYIIATKESHRYKAEFRDEEHMADRARKDLQMAMHLAAQGGTDRGSQGGGYLATEDQAFFKAERHERWGQRPRVSVLTRSIPQLADFACGAKLQDEDVVRLLYEPVLTAAAESLALEIDTLTGLGVDLKTVALPRLEWALQNDLHDAIHTFRADHYAERKLDDAARLVNLASARGLPVASFVADLTRGYDEAKKAAASSIAGETAATERLKRVVQELATTKKSRRRANRVLREFGLSVAALQAEDEDDS